MLSRQRRRRGKLDEERGDSKREVTGILVAGPEGKENPKSEVCSAKGPLRMTWERVSRKEPASAYPALEKLMEQSWAQGIEPLGMPL